MIGNCDVWNLKGESLEVHDACEQCGNVVGGRSLVFDHLVPHFDDSRFAWFLQWFCLWSWACVLLTRRCVDSGGSKLIVIVLVQRHGLCVVPFVVHASVCGHFSRKDRWCERHTHHARRRKNMVSDAACAGQSNVAVSVSASQLSAYHGQTRRENVQTLGSFPKIRTQMPRMLLVPRVDVVRC